MSLQHLRLQTPLGFPSRDETLTKNTHTKKKTFSNPSQSRKWQKPHRLNVTNPRSAFMGAFVEAWNSQTAFQHSPTGFSAQHKQPGNQPELEFCLTSLTQKHNSSFFGGRNHGNTNEIWWNYSSVIVLSLSCLREETITNVKTKLAFSSKQD